MMDFESTGFILAFYSQIDLFLLVLVRFVGFFIILPVFSGQNIPITSKIGLAVFVAYLAVISGTVTMVAYENSIMGFFLLIAQEFLTGFILAFVVYTLMVIFLFVGQIVDHMIGFSMVSVFDPMTQIQVPITGNFYYLVMTAFFIQSGSLHYFILNLFESYQTIPIGGVNLMTNEPVMRLILQLLVDYFKLGVQISLPVMGTILVVDIVLGILVKAVPQMNIFVVGMPIKVFIGMYVMFLMTPYLGDVYRFLMEWVMKYYMNLLKILPT